MVVFEGKILEQVLAIILLGGGGGPKKREKKEGVCMYVCSACRSRDRFGEEKAVRMCL